MVLNVIIIIQFYSCLFTYKLNSTVANYKVSTSTQKYTKVIKEQNTKYDNLYNRNKQNNSNNNNNLGRKLIVPCLVGYNAVYFFERQLTFRRKISPE
jgi:hypothetical protein